MSAGSTVPDIYKLSGAFLKPRQLGDLYSIWFFGFSGTNFDSVLLNFYRQQQSAAGSVWLIILQAGNNKGCTTLKHDEDGLFQTSIPTERESSVKVQYTITSDYSS